MNTKQRFFYLIGVYSVTVIFLYNNICTPKRPWYTSMSSSELRLHNIKYSSTGRKFTDICPNGLTENTQDLLCKNPIPFEKKYKNPCWYDSSGNLSCLPYFMIIGMPKCGTTDMMASIMNHPDVVPPIDKDGTILKEIHFFDGCHYGKECPYMVSFEDYAAYFRKVAQEIKLGKENAITGEATPGYLWRLYTWRFLPQNDNTERPRVIMPDIIKHILPNLRMIIILRDPVERAHSSFFYEHDNLPNPRKMFEATVHKSISQIKTCFKSKSEIECMMDSNFIIGSQVNHFLESLYYYYIKEWMTVFPRHQFLVIPFEVYMKNKTDIMNTVFNFLQLGTFSEEEMEHRGILKSMYRNTGSRIRFIPIEEKTRDLLYDFYEPYNNLLYDYLKDFRFRWQRESYSSYKTHLDEQFREKQL